MKGFFQKIIIIDVTRQETSIRPVSELMLKQNLGGKGLATHLLLAHTPPGVDPLSPDNPFLIALGPVTDTRVYGSCRYGIFSKSPLTGFYAESYSGGKVAVPMSRAGYDLIMIQGASKVPVWLEISDQGVIFHDARDLWGLATYETEDKVKALCGVKGCGAVVIGPAGENRVKFAVVENDYWRSAGRTGMGAVLGSKKIKALVFHGQSRREIHDPDGVKDYSNAIFNEFKDHPGTRIYKTEGTPVMVGALNKAGAFPTRYWSKGSCDHWEKINAQSMNEKMDVLPKSCMTCFMGCGKLSTVKAGKHKGLKIEGPEYETIYSFGGLCMIDSIEDIAWLNDICDRLGMDTMSAGNLCAFAIEASLQGRISDNLSYGNAGMIADLLHKIARREGIGGLLADGIKAVAAELGMEDQAVHVKGLEPAGYDPRVLKGMGLAYAVSPRGACHLRSTFYKPELSGVIDPGQIEDKAELFIDFEDRCTLFDSLILCRFYRDFYPWKALGNILELTTGMHLSREALQAVASHITDNTRKFNLRQGLTPEDDRLPKRFLTGKLEKGQGITGPEVEHLVQDYYRLRGWTRDGIPQ